MTEDERAAAILVLLLEAVRGREVTLAGYPVHRAETIAALKRALMCLGALPVHLPSDTDD